MFAALDVLTGEVIGQCLPRHRHEEFLRFLRTIEVPKGLKIHLILDNYATHEHPNVKAWLAKHPRFVLHFAPTSSSWLNLVERFLGKLTDKALRRGVFKSVPDLIAAIETYLKTTNENPKPFVWTATADQILDSAVPWHATRSAAHDEHLRRRLKKLGIAARTGRAGARRDLAQSLPPAILADLLGISESCAARWTAAAGREWARYAATCAGSFRS